MFNKDCSMTIDVSTLKVNIEVGRVTKTKQNEF